MNQSDPIPADSDLYSIKSAQIICDYYVEQQFFHSLIPSLILLMDKLSKLTIFFSVLIIIISLLPNSF